MLCLVEISVNMPKKLEQCLLGSYVRDQEYWGYWQWDPRRGSREWQGFSSHLNFPRKKAPKSLCKQSFQTYIYLGIYSFPVSQGVKRQMDYAKEARIGQTQFL